MSEDHRSTPRVNGPTSRPGRSRADTNLPNDRPPVKKPRQAAPSNISHRTDGPTARGSSFLHGSSSTSRHASDAESTFGKPLSPETAGQPSLTSSDALNKRSQSAHVVRFVQEVRFSAKPATVIQYDQVGNTPTKATNTIRTDEADKEAMAAKQPIMAGESDVAVFTAVESAVVDEADAVEGWGGALADAEAAKTACSTVLQQASHGNTTDTASNNASNIVVCGDAEEEAIAAEADELLFSRLIARTRSPPLPIRTAETDGNASPTQPRSTTYSNDNQTGSHDRGADDRVSVASYADDEASDRTGSPERSRAFKRFTAENIHVPGNSTRAFSMAKSLFGSDNASVASSASRMRREEGEVGLRDGSPDTGFLTDTARFNTSKLRSLSSFRWVEDESEGHSFAEAASDLELRASPVSAGIPWGDPRRLTPTPSSTQQYNTQHNTQHNNNNVNAAVPQAVAQGAKGGVPFDALAFREYKQRLQLSLALLAGQQRQATQHKQWCEQARSVAQLHPQDFARAVNRTSTAIRAVQKRYFQPSSAAASSISSGALSLPPLATRLSHLPVADSEVEAVTGSSSAAAFLNAPFLSLPYRIRVIEAPAMPQTLRDTMRQLSAPTKRIVRP